MTLDRAWLDSKARVYPVTVDPSVKAANADGTTFVQSTGTNDYSTATELHVGTYDGGTDTAKAFLAFGSVATSLQNDTVLGARLNLFNTWSYSCSPRTVYVYPVTSSWSVTGDKSWPGPSTGAAIGRKSFAHGWTPKGGSPSPCGNGWEAINLNQAGTNLINGWTHGTVADNGLALGASTSDSNAWKKFASDSTTSGTGHPSLTITYTTDGAAYKLASRKPVKLVTSSQNGEFAIKVTNTGATTWTPTNGYEMSYTAYDSSGDRVANHPVFTPMPSSVAPGASVTVDVTVDSLDVGQYALDFSMYSGVGSSPVSFTSQGIKPYAIGLDIPAPPPVVNSVYPPTGYISPVVNPQLSVAASSTSGATYEFQVTVPGTGAVLIGGTNCKPTSPLAPYFDLETICPPSKPTFSSGSISKPYWTPPVSDMQWDTQYSWTVTVTTSGGTHLSSPPAR